MLCVRNMDELLEMPLEEGWISAAHACTCNPRKLAHYPDDWSVLGSASPALTHPPRASTNSL